MPDYVCPKCGFKALPQPVKIKGMSHPCPKNSHKQVALKEVTEGTDG